MAISWIIKSHLYNSLFHFWFNPVLGNRFTAADLPKGLFTSGVIKLFDAIETVPVVPISLQARVTLFNCSAKLSRPMQDLINLVSEFMI